MKSSDYKRGFQDALIFAIEIFETRKDTMFSRKWFRRKDIKRIISILDAAFYAREKLINLGPRGMDLILRPDGSFEFRERQKKNEKDNNDNSQRTDSGNASEL